MNGKQKDDESNNIITTTTLTEQRWSRNHPNGAKVTKRLAPLSSSEGGCAATHSPPLGSIKKKKKSMCFPKINTRLGLLIWKHKTLLKKIYKTIFFYESPQKKKISFQMWTFSKTLTNFVSQ